MNNLWIRIGLSLTLLTIYLGFFHLCIGSEYSTCIALGIGGWLLWSAICFGFRGVFINRFEFLIHCLVGVDILLEGFNPVHSGYGFYWCALGFWSVFLLYHFNGKYHSVDREDRPET